MIGLQHRIEALMALLPPVLHRMALRRAHHLRTVWWRMRRPQIEGVRVLAMDAQGRVLLVRHSYGPDSWMPPGGGMATGEDPLPAGARELFEELGCTLAQARLADTILDTLHGAGNRVHVIIGQCEGDPVPDRREIVAAEFFALDSLPDNLARGLAERLPLWLAQT